MSPSKVIKISIGVIPLLYMFVKGGQDSQEPPRRVYSSKQSKEGEVEGRQIEMMGLGCTHGMLDLKCTNTRMRQISNKETPRWITFLRKYEDKTNKERRCQVHPSPEKKRQWER